MSTTVRPVTVTIPNRPINTPTHAHITVTTPSATSTSSSLGALSVNDFSATDFDLKGWINQQLAAAQSKETPTHATTTDAGPQSDLTGTTKHLSNLLMNLQLMAADINSTLETQSQELVQAMPRAMREISSIHRESQSLRVNLSDILKDMSTIEHSKPSATATAVGATVTPIIPQTPSVQPGASNPSATPAVTGNASTAASTIDFLQSIDVVNQRILRCTGTLEELDRWSKRERLLETLFDRLTPGGETILPSAMGDGAFNDLARIQSEIAHMDSIVHKFANLGIAPAESTVRLASLDAHAKKRDRLAHALLEQLLETVALNGSGSTGAGDEDPSAATSNPSTSSTAVRSHLRILRSVYSSSGRSALFESSYAQGKLKPSFKALIKRYGGDSSSSFPLKDLNAWIGKFFHDLVQLVKSERQFAVEAFGEGSETEKKQSEGKEQQEAKSNGVEASSSGTPANSSTFIISSLLAVLSTELPPLLSVWISSFLAAKKGSEHPSAVAGLWKSCVQYFGVGMQAVLVEGTDSNEETASFVAHQQTLFTLLQQPFSKYFTEWQSLEKKALFATLDQIEFGGDSYEILSGNIHKMHGTILAATTQAVQRCVDLSCGSLVEETTKALAEYYTEVVQRLFSLMRRLRRMAGLDGLAAPASNGPSAVGKDQPKKSPTSSPTAGDGLGELMSDPPPSASPGLTSQTSSTESSFQAFQGAFLLLRTCRALQWDLFSPPAEEALLGKACGSGLVQAVRQAMQQQQNGDGLTLSLATHKPRSNSVGGTGSKLLHPSQVQQHSSTHQSHQFDLNKQLSVSFLVQHPAQLKSLVAFLHAHYPPFHAIEAATPQGTPHGTQGLHSSHASTPGGGTLSGVGSITVGKYGFPSTPNPSTQGSNTHLFPSAATLFDSFISAVHNLILDTMFKPIGAKLASFHDWSHLWQAKASTAGLLSSIPLPSFSLQPSEYMIQIGEHLLTLVQQMEPFVAKQADENEDGSGTGHAVAPPSTPSLLPNSPPQPTYLEHDALYWLNLLSKGTFKHLLSSIHQLSLLSERGAKQLSCDLEYLVNVLAALGLTIPGTILKLQIWLVWNEAHMIQQLNEGRAGDEWRLDELTADEKHMMRQVIKARRFKQIEQNTQLMARINN